MKNVILIGGLFFMLVLPLSFFAHVNMTSDPLDYYKSQNPTITQEQIDMFKEQHGLDKPSLVRYVYWLKNIATGDAEVYKAYNMSIFPFIMIVLASLITGIAAVFILKKP
jgi:ABC-type dipeptide/oligopeptide/nickel transport system permease component